jgi:mono/diheme cytochrome c family protein
MKRIFWIVSIFIATIFILASSPFEIDDLDRSRYVNDVLKELGEDSILHQVNTLVPGVSARKGEEIVKNGFTDKPGFGKSRRVSKHFVCTSCHNIQQEDPDLRYADPQARLLYTNIKGLPFLQGSPLYGIVNRSKFYNQDYYKKYGLLVYKARNDIRESIQLCAVECSQGRKLKDWEVESILAFFWEIGLKLEDLELEEEDIELIEMALAGEAEKGQAIERIKSKYLDYSPAHFVNPPENRTVGNGLKGIPENGKMIYEQSCLHCHYQKRYSFFHLDNERPSFNLLNKHIKKYTKRSIYQVVRYGTPPLNLKKAYMPHYTMEKMDRQQIEDLRSYIELRAEGNEFKP